MAEAAALGPMEVCREAGIQSLTTLYRVYNDLPVKQTTRVKVEQAIRKLSSRQAVS